MMAGTGVLRSGAPCCRPCRTVRWPGRHSYVGIGTAPWDSPETPFCSQVSFPRSRCLFSRCWTKKKMDRASCHMCSWPLPHVQAPRTLGSSGVGGHTPEEWEWAVQQRGKATAIVEGIQSDWMVGRRGGTTRKDAGRAVDTVRGFSKTRRKADRAPTFPVSGVSERGACSFAPFH